MLKGDIGIFDKHNDSPGIEYLMTNLIENNEICQEDVQNLVKSVSKGRLEQNLEKLTVYSDPVPGLLSEDECKNLIHQVDQNWDLITTDFKLQISFDELKKYLSEKSFQTLYDTMEGDFNEIIIRRCVGIGLCINFHVDYSLKTLQIALNGDDEYEGGKLIFATKDGQLRTPVRSAGSMTIHNNTVVHGVTKHSSGIRYGLFLLKSN